ncbi:hypothetical protein FRX31_012339, partial [Thalictrum thalictroides]
MRFVDEEWRRPCFGAPIYKFQYKLKRLKLNLKQWNQYVFGNINANVRDAEAELLVWQARAEEHPEDDNVYAIFNQKQVALEHALKVKDDFWKQKSGNKWFHLSDRNTAYYQALCKVHSSQNLITSLLTEDGVVLNSQQDIKDHIVSYFESKFTEQPVVIHDE